MNHRNQSENPPNSTELKDMHPIDFALHYAFHYSSYRDDQREIVAAALENRDIFVLKCTGGGKSLCFQIPAILSRGVTVVFCPLLSLLQDQIQSLLNRPCGGIPCCYLSGECVGVSYSIQFLVTNTSKACI